MLARLLVIIMCVGLATSLGCSPREEDSEREKSTTLVSSTSGSEEPGDPSPSGSPPDKAGSQPVVDAPPGAEPFPAPLRAELADALAASSDEPRTRHLRKDGSPLYANRLLLEQSPYLRQHAHNPVNWYSWGPEAFEKARELDRPVFLSIGYSTCHWCHVMEEESFEDEEIGRFLNEHFVAVKVDREERPDIDATYMKVVTAMTGSGGWPATIVMTPDRRPFFAATYIPPRAGERGAQAGLLELLKLLSTDYAEQREEVVAEAEKVTGILLSMTERSSSSDFPSSRTLLSAAERLLSAHDRQFGGIGHQRKFPRPSVIRLMLRIYRRSGDPGWLHAAQKTLDHILEGGIRDHVGGGFHRYSVDRRWRVPHFEKMLYTNAELTSAFLEAWQATGKERYRQVVEDTLAYVDREMTAKAGAFYSATDADSDGEEGLYFIWTPEQLADVLDPAETLLVTHHYGVTERGDFEGANVLRVDRPLDEVVALLADSGVSGVPGNQDEARAMLAKARRKLLNARSKRTPPLLDDKAIAAWNGLMISALARAGLALDRPEYVTRAVRAANFVLEEMVVDDRLQRTWRNGEVSGEAYLQDYAAMVGALLDLYEATGTLRWLNEAIAMQRDADRLFLSEDGAYYLTGEDQEKLLIREHPFRDGSIPGGNSMMALNLFRLEELTTEQSWGERGRGVLVFFSKDLEMKGTSAPWMLSALDFELDSAREVVLLGTGAKHPLMSTFNKSWLPNRVLVQATPDNLESVSSVIPFVEGKRLMGGKPTAYVCEAGRCEIPTSDPDVFKDQLDNVEPYETPTD